MSDVIVAEGLVKRYGETRALDGLDLVVPEGTALGLLGPNGAGKTTAVRVLTTLLRPDGGRALVAGIDVTRDPAAVRRRIGLAGQFTALDYTLTGRENLVMFGRLYRLGRRQANRRADRLLDSFGLTDVGSAAVKTYSGGMARRLDLASALIATPRVLFMDEPTSGLDPAARLELWDLLEEMVRGGVTLLLTTQYLEEADRLASRIAVVDRGRVIASGSPDELKRRVGGDRVDVRLADPGQLPAAVVALRELAHGEPVVDPAGVLGLPADGDGSAAIAEVVRALDRHRIGMLDISTHRPTLDDVFLAMTGAGAAARIDGAELAPWSRPVAEPVQPPVAVEPAPVEPAPVEPAPVVPAAAAPALREIEVHMTDPVGLRVLELVEERSPAAQPDPLTDPLPFLPDARPDLERPNLDAAAGR